MMSKRKLINRLDNALKDKELNSLHYLLHDYYFIEEDNSISISVNTLKALGVNPEDYEDLPSIPGLEDKMVRTKKAYITDPFLFNADGNYRLYPEFKIITVKFE